MLALNNLKKHPKSTHSPKRVGRGNASGHGTYSTRGLKGQRSRSGGKGGLKLRGIRGYLLRIPKTRGFKSGHIRPTAISLNQLESAFQAKEMVSPKKLELLGLLSSSQRGTVKIIGGGKLTKALTVKTHFITPSAREAIEAAGGTIEILTVVKPIASSEKTKS